MQREFLTSVLNPTRPVNLPYKLILFDFDGTLCHTEGVDIESIQKTYQVLKQPIPTKTSIQSALRKGFVAEGILKHLSPNAPLKEIHQLLLTYKAMYQTKADAAELFPGVLPVLKQLKAVGVLSVLVSNKAMDLLESAVNALQLNEYFEKIVGVKKEGLCKPDISVWEQSIKPYIPSIEPEKILMVGDTSTDLKFAQAMEVDSAWATYGLGDPESCQALEPTYELQSINDLLDIILFGTQPL